MKKMGVYSFFVIGCLAITLLYVHTASIQDGNVKGAKTQRTVTTTPTVSPSVIYTYEFTTLSKKTKVILPTSTPQGQQSKSDGLLISSNNTQTSLTTTPSTTATTSTPTTIPTITGNIPSIAPAISNQSPHAKVTLTFDDGLESAYQYAAPLLQKYGFAGTEYVPTSCIGSVDTCPENSSASYMTWSQVQSLQNIYHWEIGSHSVTTPLLSLETKSQIDNELSQSKQILEGYGLNVLSFATPYGDYNNLVLAEIAKYYTSQRPFQDVGYGIFPYNDYMLYDQQVQGGVTVAQVEKWINSAEKTNQWLVLTFHDILPKASTNPQDYEYSIADFENILKYLKSQNVSVVTASQGISTSSTNMFVNGSFKDGINDGWTTDSASNVVANNQDNGRYPDPIYSIKFTSSTSNVHLFSPTISVNPNQTYVVKSFLDMVNTPISGGRFNYIVDEYDANGNWLNSKTFVYEQDAYVEEMTFAYTPSSQAVSKIRLQFDVAANSNILAYLSGVQMFPEDVTGVPPLNLMPNGNFDNGLSDGWTTDNAADITFDTNNNGSSPSPATSISLVSGISDSHLYSPEIPVNYAQRYTIDSYLNLKTITSVLSFYIDEYDKNGTWVSGHNVKFVSSPYNGEIEVPYTPSSNTVKYARLQVVVPANSGITAYFDSAYWY